MLNLYKHIHLWEEKKKLILIDTTALIILDCQIKVDTSWMHRDQRSRENPVMRAEAENREEDRWERKMEGGKTNRNTEVYQCAV